VPLTELSLTELVELSLVELPLTELVELPLTELSLVELSLTELVELPLTELTLTELVERLLAARSLVEWLLAQRPLAGRPRSLSRPEGAWTRLSGSELALPVADWALPRRPLPVSGLAGRPGLPLPVGILPWPGPVPGTWPAGATLARPRLLTWVLA